MEKIKKLFKGKSKIEDRVRAILENFPPSRDSDELLMWIYWSYQRGDLDNMSISTFRQMFFAGFETISRVSRERRRLQAEDKKLRGPLYGMRKRAEEYYREYFNPRVTQLSILENPESELREAMETIYQNIKPYGRSYAKYN